MEIISRREEFVDPVSSNQCCHMMQVQNNGNKISCVNMNEVYMIIGLLYYLI